MARAARKYEVVEATLEHIALIAADIRQADLDEIEASTGQSAEEVLTLGVKCSAMAWTAFGNGKALCMFGVTPLSVLGSIGVPWMLGTNELERHATKFLRNSKPYVVAMQSAYNHLVNYVDDRNDKAIAWLKWLGFQMGEPEPYGHAGLPFRRFEMRA